MYFGTYTGIHIPEPNVFDICLRDNLKSCLTLASEFLQELDNKMEYIGIFIFQSSRARITTQGKIGYMFRLD